MSERFTREDAKRWWLQCISCSEASVTQHNRSFGVEETDMEQAVGLFSGGFLHQGDACGLLQGSVLSAGVQAEARFPDAPDVAASCTIQVAQTLVERYPETSGHENCRDITQVDFTTIRGRVDYMREGKARACGKLSLAWVPRGHDTIEEQLTALEQDPPPPCHSCVMRAARRMDGLDDSDAVRLSGYSGGVGLSGNVCGVLASGVYALALRHYRGRGAKRRDSQLVSALQETGFQVGLRKQANQLRTAFEKQFGGRLCQDLVGRRFDSVQDHSAFIEGGGCAPIIEFAAQWVNGS